MRDFDTRQEYIDEEVSEKITLVHLTSSSRLFDFVDLGSNLYSKVTPHVITSITGLTESTTVPLLTNNQFHYDIKTRLLTINTDEDIDNKKIIVKYRLFFADSPVITTWNFDDNSEEVEYQARINRAPEFKSAVGTNQKGSSLTNSGNLELENNDGYFDTIYDSLVFENKEVTVYSWNRSLKPSQAKIVFRGNIYDKSFSSDTVSFQVKNAFTRVQESITLETYTELDNVSSQFIGNYKRRVYGRVNQMLVRSVDQVGSGYNLTGTISTNPTANTTVTGKLTQFLTDPDVTIRLATSDVVEIDSQRFDVVSVPSDTSVVISSSDPITVNVKDGSMSKVDKNPANISLSGSISSDILNLRLITGSGTLFTSQLSTSDTILVRGRIYNISSITSDTVLELDTDVLELFNLSPFTKYITLSLNGTIDITSPARLVTGLGTAFLDEVSPSDVVTIAGTTFSVENVLSDTELLVDGDDPITSTVSGITISNVPELPWRKRNREFLVSGHALSEYSSNIDVANELNRLTVLDASGFSPADIVSIMNGPTFIQNAEILRVVNNQITFKLNLRSRYPSGYTITKQPISNVYIDTIELQINDLQSLSNTTSGCSFTISELSEFNIANSRNINVNFRFISGSREVITNTLSITDLTGILKPRDFIKASGDPDIYFTEVLSVGSNTVTLRTEYQGGSSLNKLTYRSPATISDDSSVTVNCLGKTVDGTPTSPLLENGPEIVKDLLNEIDLTSVLDLSSFDESNLDSPYFIGMTIPEDITSTTLPTIKVLTDRIGRTITGALVINSDLQLAYSILDVKRPTTRDLRVITFDDLTSWRVSSKSGNLYKSVNVNFNFRDYDNLSKLKDKSVLDIDSQFVKDFDTSNKTDSIDLFTNNEIDADELGQRYAYYNSLSQADITLRSDLRLSDLSIGQTIILNIPRLYKRLGDSNTSLKVCTVTGINIDGKSTEIIVNDLGNLFNKSSVITNNDEVEYDIATSEQKVYSSYITSENGTINNDEDTTNTNLIF